MAWNITSLLPKPLKSLAIRFDRSPIKSVESLAEFSRTRSSYVAQTSLYGYLKARMGTRFPSFFEDEVFSVSIRESAAQLFVSCLGDMTIYAIAIAAKGDRLDDNDATDLAQHCFKIGLERTLADLDTDLVPSDAVMVFQTRARQTEWAPSANGRHAFAGSERDLVLFAPVVDEFKKLDKEIVSNSIRFRWRDVREQLRRRIDEEHVCGDWQRLATSSRASEP
jgi:hypothetical protein